LILGTPSTPTGVSEGTGIQQLLTNTSILSGTEEVIFNFTLNTTVEGRAVFFGDIRLMDGDNEDLRIRVNNTDTGEDLIVMQRSTDTGMIGSMGINGIFENVSVGVNNFSVSVYSAEDIQLESDTSFFILSLTDNNSYIVGGNNVYTQEELTSPTTETAGTELILSDTFTQLDGDAMTYIYSASHESTGNSNVLFRINVTESANSSNVLSSDIIERDYDESIGNQFIYGYALNLIEGTEYNISVTRIINGDDV